MADWQRELDLTDLWKKEEAGEITVQEIAKELAKRLEALAPFGFKNEGLDHEKENLVGEFEDIANDPSADQSDFNYLMDVLYDWADTPLVGAFSGKRSNKKACWVKTIFS